MRTQILTFTLVACGVVWAQPPGGGRGRMMRPNPVMTALDGDKDGTISAAEIAGAPAALKSLDKNGDGVLAAEEVRPQMPERDGGQAVDIAGPLFSFDANKDGKLTKEEVPERMQGIFARADADKDGQLTREEIAKASAGQERRGGGEGGPPMDPLTRALDANRDGALSEAEIAGAVAALKTLDKNGDGVLSGEEIRPAMRGGRDPREMVNHLFEENDANKDGKLSKAEMPERMAEMFERLDADKDGFVTKEELSQMGGRRRE
ncbi:MAG: EF-hand domain-containing protein [Bryobacterales bacterium]|nr:EF-hand domain-containing protein [Bryobacterales bacterium]